MPFISLTLGPQPMIEGRIAGIESSGLMQRDEFSDNKCKLL